MSGLYRIWGRIRARQLDESWQSRWANTEMYGGRKGRGPEPLLFQVCLELESADDDNLVAGLSFCMVKAFDRIPRELLGRILSKMSMPANVLIPCLGMLRFATRRYKTGEFLLTNLGKSLEGYYRAVRCQCWPSSDA